MKIIQSFSQIDKKFSPRMKEFHITGKPLLKAGVVALCLSVALAGGYVLDVWALGTAAAWLHGLGVKFQGLSVFATVAQKEAAKHAFDSMGWYWHHPFLTAWAWLTTPAAMLSNPGVRDTWLWLNLLVAVGGATGAMGWKLRNGRLPAIKIRKSDATHGSALWAGKKDLSRVCEFGFGPGIVLGRHEGSPVRIPQKLKARHNKNVLVVGSPGCGKSFSYARPNIFAAVRGDESIIVTDPKGELHRDMAPFLTSKGYEVKVLNLVRMKESHEKNFLDEIRTPLDADVFTQVVIATTEGGPKKGGDGFWDRAERCVATL